MAVLRRRFQTGAACAACMVLMLTGTAAAQAVYGSSAGYEGRRLAKALAERGLVRAENPEGKRIGFVQLARHEVFEFGEFWPDWVVWFNRLHVRTRKRVIRRELTFEVGEPYAQAAADETMRNLQALGIFALVRVVPVKSDVPGEIGVLVFTRDLWSLRTETDFAGAAGTLQALGQITERNLFGNNMRASLRFTYRPFVMAFGQALRNYRLFGERIEFVQAADLFYNYAQDRFEGGQVSLQVGRPFYRLQQAFAFDLTLAHRSAVHRDLDGARVAQVDLSDAAGDNCDPAEPACALSVYDAVQTSLELAGHYRLGTRYKQTWTAGAGFSRRHYQSNPESQADPSFGDAFSYRVLPRSRTSVYPLARYRLFIPDFVYFRNLGTFGRTETVQRGPILDASMVFPLSSLGSTYDAVVVRGEAGFTWAAGDFVAGVDIEAGARLEQGQVRDQFLWLRARGATPPWLLGRLVAQTSFSGRRRDTARTFVALGGDTGLRGYPSGFERGYGAQRLLANVEYRTLPMELLSIQVGGVLFFDAGSVYPSGKPPDMHYGAGAGLRLVVPQFNVDGIRLDFGVPLGGHGASVLLSYGWEQVVPLTPREDLLQEEGL